MWSLRRLEQFRYIERGARRGIVSESIRAGEVTLPTGKIAVADFLDIKLEGVEAIVSSEATHSYVIHQLAALTGSRTVLVNSGEIERRAANSEPFSVVKLYTSHSIPIGLAVALGIDDKPLGVYRVHMS